MAKDIEVAVMDSDGAKTIVVQGDLTAVTGPELEDAYARDEVAGAPRVVLAFDESCYINSGGIAFLIDIASRARKNGQKLCVSGLSDHFQKIFKMVGLTRCMEVIQ